MDILGNEIEIVDSESAEQEESGSSELLESNVCFLGTFIFHFHFQFIFVEWSRRHNFNL